MYKHPLELSDVFHRSFADYCKHGPTLSMEHYKVAKAIMNCHTATLGGHVFQCEQCRHEKVAYNSCRNRHCPSCQAAARFKWVAQRIKELLPVPYFHVVFTIPSQLNPFALRNKRVVYNILYKAAAETLRALAAREKYLGANIGFIAVLHTWGQNLMDHPHLHCVVPAGGLSDDRSQWKTTPRESFLFPVKVVSRLFRGKFLALFRSAVDNGDILFHGNLQAFETDPKSFRLLVDSLYKTEWVVYAKAPLSLPFFKRAESSAPHCFYNTAFAGPEAVLKYLGRYTHRIAISNNRLTDLTEEAVSFKWKDYADNNRPKVMTLSHCEFLRRFLLHALPTGFVRIRYFGFLGQAVKKEKLQLCRTLLGVKAPEPDEEKAGDTRNNDDGTDDCSANKHRWLCPLCKKGVLIPTLEIPRSPQRNVELAAVA
jgi:hypothetical protein